MPNYTPRDHKGLASNRPEYTPGSFGAVVSEIGISWPLLGALADYDHSTLCRIASREEARLRNRSRRLYRPKSKEKAAVMVRTINRLRDMMRGRDTDWLYGPEMGIAIDPQSVFEVRCMLDDIESMPPSLRRQLAALLREPPPPEPRRPRVDHWCVGCGRRMRWEARLCYDCRPAERMEAVGS